MRRTISGVVVVLAASVLPVAGAAPARAADDPWRPVLPLGSGGTAAPAVATDDRREHPVAAHSAPHGTGRAVVVRRLAAGAGGPQQVALDGLDQVLNGSRLAVARDGTAWVAAEVTSAGTRSARVVGVRPDGSRVGAWTLPGVGVRPTPVVDPAGVPTLVWLDRTGTTGWAGIRASQWRNGAWTVPVTVTSDEVEWEDWDLAVDGAGTVSVAWVASEFGAEPRVRQLAATGTWAATTTVAAGGTVGPRHPVLRANHRGDLVLAWHARHAGDVRRVRAAYRSAGGEWTPSSAPVSEGGVLAEAPYQPPGGGPATTLPTRPSAAIGPNGEASVAWVRSVGGVNVLEASRHLGGAAWGYSAQLSLPGHRAYESEAIVDARGVTVFAWSDSTGVGSEIHALSLEPNSVVRARLGGGPEAYWPHLAALVDGSVVAVWGETTGDAEQARLRVRDAGGPATTVTGPAASVQRGTQVPFAWSASDPWSPIASYDAEVTTASHRGGFGSWRPLASGGATSATVAAAPGETVCVRARARDSVANAGGWSGRRCAVVPLDDRAARAKGGWKRVKARSAYLGTLTRATRRGAMLRLAGVQASELSLVVTRCRTCGTVKVSFGGRKLGRFSLKGRKAAQTVVPLASFPGVRSGTLVVKVVSRGRPVPIDAIAVRRD
ncbi:hypothetical protein ACJ5H2_01435 [Nocardioides sp. R1-1]|uniref:hypothetical protein n=1 Tax=Nocardioides sp. R1-1 TaxID=3383502 RepID=UPI0038CF7CF9